MNRIALLLTTRPTLVTSDVDELTKDLLEATGEVTAAAAMEIMQRLIAATPVKTGHARSNWIASVGFAHNTIDGSKKQVNTSLQEASMDRLSFYHINQGALFIVNNVPYISKLNDGYSPQAPLQFVEEITDEVDSILGSQTIMV